ncbi:MAG TPA: carboxypeptidase-like regulatory domain-containing protein [Gemmatimonadaceae bacterium]|nr:carboxypeptidase-like regulatory domain-containing protein [Gemmatimonadaceae bacterium]
MRSRRLAFRALVAAVALAATPVVVRAQDAASRRIAATQPPPITTDPGATITAAIRLGNRSRDSIAITPRVAVPADWSLVLGTLPITLGPRAGDVWLVSARVPASAPAGRYAIQLRAADRSNATLVRDSVIVNVRPHRAIELAVAERPTYAISGSTYRALVLARNSGNVAASYRLLVNSSLGGVLDVHLPLSLAAGESRMLRVDVTSTTPGLEAREDVLDFVAIDEADTSATARASTHVTIVQRAGAGNDLHTVNSTLRVRAASASTGVSPFVLTGAGPLREGGATQVDFLLRGPTSSYSPFGDREEYRVGLRGNGFRVQAGDGLYGATPLTSAGQQGFGGALEVGDSTFGGGAFAQRFRLVPGQGAEQGLFLRLGGDASIGAPRLGFAAVNRAGGALDGRVLSMNGRLHPGGDMVVDLEYADSRGNAGRDVARSARLSGGTTVHVDLGHRDVGPHFAGIGRGTTYDYANVATLPWNELQLTASGSRVVTRGAILGLDLQQQMRTSLVALSWVDHLSLGYTTLSRDARSLLVPEQSQRGVVTRAQHMAGLTHLWGSLEVGRAHDDATSPSHPYHQASAGVSAPLLASTVTLWAEESRGAMMLRGAEHALTIGGDAEVRVTALTTLSVGGSMTRASVPPGVLDPGGYTQVDARLTRELPSGASLGMRVRLGGRAFSDAALGQKLAYLEYSMPLQVPVGPAREPGRVRGRVVDEQTGRGVAGALVRLGPQAAITDDEGRVAFAGLPAGSYRVALANQLSSGPSVFTGSPVVVVDESRHAPSRFDVAVEPAGSITGSVRQVVIARTGIGSSPDSLTDGGPLEGVSVALAGARDTVYRTTDASGTFTFTDVPSGSWTLIVRGETPAQAQWEKEHIPVVMGAGEHRTVTFRLVPKRRRVKIVGGDGFDESKQEKQDRQDERR